MVQAPTPDRFPTYPVSWYLFCPSAALRRGPFSREVVGRRLVAFRTARGRVCVLDAHCAHLGADLGRGQVVGEALQCPFHRWEYGADGLCTHIPATREIPPGARLARYPVQERHGFVFFFSGPEPLFPLPFFDGCRPEDLRPARPFETVLDCPWYLVAANHFDLQHFQTAHDRVLTGPHTVTSLGPYARSASATFRVEGRSLQDRLTRWFGGPEVTLSLTDWCGNLMFTTATLRRARSYGMMATEPLADGRVRVRVVVFVRRAATALGRALLDPLRLWLRRQFIKSFLSADTDLLNGIRYNPHGLLECDRELAEYLRWLAAASRGRGAWSEPRPSGSG